MATMRTCKQCGIEKPLHRFERNKHCLEGRCSTCKDCRNEYHRRKYRLKDDSVASYNKAYKESHKVEKRAEDAVWYLVRNGKLVPSTTCDWCGIKCKTEAHHHNGYDEEHKLDVVWICRPCHRMFHAKNT